MKIATKKTNGKASSTARVVDGKLILSFPEALNPVVWQMDLVQAKASALEVTQNAKGNFILSLKTGKGEATEIAPFATKDEAVSALMAAAAALENAHGQIRPLGVVTPGETTHTAAPVKSGRGSKWAATFLGILLIFILLGIWGSLAPRPPSGTETASGTRTNNASGFGATEENGVPLSADEFLMKRQP